MLLFAASRRWICDVNLDGASASPYPSLPFLSRSLIHTHTHSRQRDSVHNRQNSASFSPQTSSSSGGPFEIADVNSTQLCSSIVKRCIQSADKPSEMARNSGTTTHTLAGTTLTSVHKQLARSIK